MAALAADEHLQAVIEGWNWQGKPGCSVHALLKAQPWHALL